LTLHPDKQQSFSFKTGKRSQSSLEEQRNYYYYLGIIIRPPALFALFCRKIRTAGAAEGAAPRASSARVATSLTDASGPARLSAPHATLLGTEGEKAQNYFGETLAVLPVM
jgi:hypothetical protein